ncbi:MAG: penicillin-insensitive murein endopeptidase, partial [Mesorhizobium sp.]
MKTATRSFFGKRSLLAAALGLLALTGLAQPAAAEERAKDLFGAE